MKNNHDKMMTDLNRLLETQNFKTQAEIQQFLDSLVGGKIPSFPQEALSLEEKAQDLVFEAYNLPLSKAKLNISKALLLDKNCIEAYEFLGSKEPAPEIAIVFFEKGITIGRQIFGGKFLEETKGFFWGVHKTRPYMRCLYNFANCLLIMDKIEEGIAIFEEMIELNPNDNQGVRYLLQILLLETDEFEKFRKYDLMFDTDQSTFALFNRALNTFILEGDSIKANKCLKVALERNKYVAKNLLSRKEIVLTSNTYSIGDENEADYYAQIGQLIWQNTDGATNWLKKNIAKIT